MAEEQLKQSSYSYNRKPGEDVTSNADVEGFSEVKKKDGCELTESMETGRSLETLRRAVSLL